LGEEKSNSSAKRENQFSHVEDGASDERGDCIDCFWYVSSSTEGIPSSTMNIFQWNNIIKEVSRCRVSIHETDIHGPNIGN
jgi:hypothetical protein